MKIEMTRHQEAPGVTGVNPDTLQDYWKILRCTGPDVYTIQMSNGLTTQKIDNGWMPHKREEDITTDELRECVEQLETISEFVEAHLAEAFAETHNTEEFVFHEVQANHCYAIYCKCSDGTVGVGWRFRDGDLVKARLMAIFTLYALGMKKKNAEADPLLGEMCYRRLPFDMQMDVRTADKVLAGLPS